MILIILENIFKSLIRGYFRCVGGGSVLPAAYLADKAAGHLPGCGRIAAFAAMFGVVFTQTACHWGRDVGPHLRFGIGRRSAEENPCAAEQHA